MTVAPAQLASPGAQARPRVLLAALSFGEGLGGAALSSEIVAQLLDRDFEVAVLTAANYSKRPGVHELRLAGQRAAVPLLARIPTTLLGIRRQVERVVQQFRPDIIHLQDADLVDPLIPVARRHRIPALVTLRDARFSSVLHGETRRLNGPESLWAQSRAFLDLMQRGRPVTWGLPLLLPMLHAKRARVRSLLNRATLLLPISRYIAEQARACGVSAPIRVMGLLPVPEWPPAQSANGAMRFLTISRLVRGKGVDVLLRSFARVRREMPAATLLIAGEGPEHHRLAELARTLGCADHVEFLGNVPHERALQLFAQGDIVVLPSLAPGTPPTRVVLEAMTAGRPVIATRAGGLPEIIDERCGVLVEPGAVEDLAQAMLELASDTQRQQEMVAAGRERAREFRPDRLRDQLCDLYGSVLFQVHRWPERRRVIRTAPAWSQNH